jgi:hypothetical protein
MQAKMMDIIQAGMMVIELGSQKGIKNVKMI